MESARPATDDDLPVLVQLWRSALAEVGPTRGGASLLADLSRTEPLEPALRADLVASDRVVVSGCIDDVVVGVAAAALHRPPGASDRPTAVVEMLYVEPGARSIGVGEAMMDRVLAWATTHRCSGVDAPALPGAREAKAFFETTGMVARLLVMHRPLADPLDAAT